MSSSTLCSKGCSLPLQLASWYNTQLIERHAFDLNRFDKVIYEQFNLDLGPRSSLSSGLCIPCIILIMKLSAFRQGQMDQLPLIQ